MKLIDRVPKSVALFFEGFFLSFGAMASAGIILFPVVLIIGISSSKADRLQALVEARPAIGALGLCLSLFVSYVVYQWKTDPFVRRGVIVAIIMNILSSFGSIFG